MSSDAREQFGEDLDAYRRAVLLEAVHAVETGEGFSAVLVED